jgi:hypothetical protein
MANMPALHHAHHGIARSLAFWVGDFVFHCEEMSNSVLQVRLKDPPGAAVHHLSFLVGDPK